MATSPNLQLAVSLGVQWGCASSPFAVVVAARSGTSPQRRGRRSGDNSRRVPPRISTACQALSTVKRQKAPDLRKHVPKVRLELHSHPCKHWASAETCGIRTSPAPVRPNPQPKMCTMYTPRNWPTPKDFDEALPWRLPSLDEHPDSGRYVAPNAEKPVQRASALAQGWH
jgi:hypothetical protein